jgi:N-hydroxyarylamine O-acetyltransferase
MSFEIAGYLERIELASRPPITLAGLVQLQTAQMSTIACENIRALLGSSPDLSTAVVCHNLIVARQGGNAEELNILLGLALKSIGFAARPALGHIGQGQTSLDQSFHSAWIVSFEGQDWLIDAGLGTLSPFTPILESKAPQASCGAMFRVIIDQNSGRKVMQRKTGESWVSLYSYVNSPTAHKDLHTAKEVSRRKGQPTSSADLIVSMHLPNGRLSILNNLAKSEADIGTRVFELSTFKAFAKTIRQTFKLNYSDEQLLGAWSLVRADRERQAA